MSQILMALGIGVVAMVVINLINGLHPFDLKGNYPAPPDKREDKHRVDPDDYRYTAEDIETLLDRGGGARWHEGRAEELRRQIAEQGTIAERQRKDLAFHEQSAAAIRLAAALRGAPELADRE
jgi:hypothetical protein